jgi:DNA-binding ferritin-like protein
MSVDHLIAFVASFKAAEMWMHAAHHLTKGPAFIAAHESLYGKIYETIGGDYDTLIEKLVYSLDNEEIACPIMISSLAAKILMKYDSPANLDERNISAMALVLLVDHMKGIEKLRGVLEASGMLTLGMDDFLSAAFNQYESYAYKLNQHLKV